MTTTAIMVDVVARDRRGNPITDLSASDFELYEDGVRQQVASFRLVSRGIGFSIVPPRGVGADVELRGPETVIDPDAGAGVLALVFDRLSPDARLLAHKAAASHLGESRLPGDRIGVFAIDLSLRTLQGFTSDQTLIRQALDRAAGLPAAQYVSAADRRHELTARRDALERQGQAGLATAATVGPMDPGAALQTGALMGDMSIDQLSGEMEMRALQTFESLERDQQGYATSNGLLAIVNSLRLVAGRKTVVFFSEGLALPPAAEHEFRSVIDLANRSNVTIYTVDAGGLRVENVLDEARREILAATDERMRQLASGRSSSNQGAMMRTLERNEDLLRRDPHSGLVTLAETTGGFLIRDTNDLSAGFRRIDEDMRFHYLLTYVPRNQEFDGRYREIGVKVTRPGVDLRARKGYYAVREAGPAPVLAHEAPVLAFLERSTVPNAFPVRAAALAFPEQNRPGLLPVLVQVPTEALGFQIDGEAQRYVTDFTILVRIKDEADQVVRKMSQQYELSGPIEGLPLARMGEVLFYRDPELAPGVYTLEAIVYDALTDRASARLSTIEVSPWNEGGLRVSSLMLVRRSEGVPPAERDEENPLYYGDLLLYPNLGEPLLRAADRELSFYIAVYPGQRSTALSASVELHRGGRLLARVPAELPAPDARGRIQHVGRLPLDAFEAGSYELRLAVSDGRVRVTRSAAFTVLRQARP